MARDHDSSYIPSQREMDAKAARLEDENQERIAAQFKVKDGKFMGLIPIPPELERTFGLIINPLIAGIATHAGLFAKKSTHKILGMSAFKDIKDPELIGKIAQTGATGAVIALDTILSAYSITKERATNYIHLVHETKGMAEEIGADAHNKMLALAYRKYHESWGSDIKKLIPSVVQLVSTLPYAVDKYNHIWDTDLFAGTAKATAVSAGGKKLTKTEVLEDWQKNHAHKYSDYPREDQLEFKNAFLEQHGYSTSSTQIGSSHSSHNTNNRHPNGQFDITDLFTEKWTVALPAFAGFIAPDIRHWATKEDRKKNEKLNSLEMVEALRGRVKAGFTTRIHDDVVEIFEQFEKDIGHKEFSSPLLVERTRPIAQAIASGKLSVRGLIRLVGEDMVVSHVGGNRELKSEEEIQNAILAVSASVLSKDNEASKSKFISRFEKSAAIEEAISKNIADMKEGPERDFFIALMPLEVLEHAKLSKKDIREARVRAQEHIYDNVAAGVIHIASQDEEYLKEHGLSFKEIQYLQAVSKKIMAGDMKTLHELVDNKKEGLACLVSAALIAEQADKINGDKETWSARVGEGRKLDEIIEKAASHREKHQHEVSEEDREKPMPSRHREPHTRKSPMDHARRGEGSHHYEQGF